MNKNNEEKIRVRFAPSPTGLLHVGSFRTALFNWLFARKNGGTFILRIEDTDRTRSKDEFLESQLADLKWMGLDWDEGPQVGGKYAPYFQMERLETYNNHCKKLLDAGLAYKCWCTADELKSDREKAQEEGKDPGYSGKCRELSSTQIEAFEKEGRKPCIRFRVPKEGITTIADVIKGDVPFENRLIDDFVIMKSDGIPTYNFAVVVDDNLMDITHVIRGDEHMSNTPKQALLFDAFGYERPVFCHIPIILNEDRTKLSKRKGAVHLLEYRERGYLKEAMLNFLALLGWAPKDNREIMSKEELIEAFSLDGIPKHPAVFDENKLIWMNGQYINILPTNEIIEELKPFINKRGFDSESRDLKWYEKAVGLYKERMKTLVEFAENLSYFFIDKVEYDQKGAAKNFKPDFVVPALVEIAERYSKTDNFSEQHLEEILRSYADEIGQSAGKVIHAVRLACTGVTATPPLFDVIVLLGREETVKRLKTAAEFITENKEKIVAGAI